MQEADQASVMPVLLERVKAMEARKAALLTIQKNLLMHVHRRRYRRRRDVESNCIPHSCLPPLPPSQWCTPS